MSIEIQKSRERIFFGTPIVSPEELFDFDNQSEEQYDCVITIRTASTVSEVKEFLKKLKKGRVYSFEDYLIKNRLNCKIDRIPQIQTHVVDHCNLNCCRCTHLSSLAKSGKDAFWLEEKQFDSDVKRIAELTQCNVDEYQLGGGEPFLHPELWKFPYIIKKHLPNTRVIIITNGTLFEKIDDRLKKSLQENDVLLWVTRYPINIDYDEELRKLKDMGIDATYGNSGNSNEELKEMWGIAYRPQGDLDGQKNFECCPARCFMLKDGRLYLCAQAAYVNIFNDYFKRNLPNPEENSIDIYKANSLKELMTFFSKKLVFCDYCDTLNRMPAVPWYVSKREIGEWVDLSKK